MINIEILINLVEEENLCYADYIISGKNLYKGDYSNLEKRKNHLKDTDRSYYAAQSATQAVMDVLEMDREQRKRLYVITRSVIKWRIRTNYMLLIPDNMKQQIEKFIFS